MTPLYLSLIFELLTNYISSSGRNSLKSLEIYLHKKKSTLEATHSDQNQEQPIQGYKFILFSEFQDHPLPKIIVVLIV